MWLISTIWLFCFVLFCFVLFRGEVGQRECKGGKHPLKIVSASIKAYSLEVKDAVIHSESYS